MSSNLTPRLSQGSRPLLKLAAWLEKTHHRDDKVVSFPANTSDAIIHARPRGTQYDMHDVQTIVAALEGRDSTICERLDSLSLTILCSIFIYSQQCLAQQRGLYLLAGALHRTKRDTAYEAAQKQRKKIAVGQAALTSLIKGFLNYDAPDKLRRWLGILALELLEGCIENAEKLRSDPPGERYWQHLGEDIKHGNCQVLKLLAGSMIREMVSLGVSPDDFWQNETSSDLNSKFPKGRHHNSQWVTSFEEFVDELVLEKRLTQEVSSVMFAHAACLGDRRWDVEETPDILVTISTELSIIVPANEVSPATYIDVPRQSILNVHLDNEIFQCAQQPTYGLVIQLTDRATSNCILNASESAERHVRLGFSSKKIAHALERLLVPKSPHMNGFRPHGRLGATDTSEHISSDDELAAPGRAFSNSQRLMGTASPTNGMLPNGNTVRTIDPSKLERDPTSQRAPPENRERLSILTAEYDEECGIFDHNVEMAAEGIDVSENELLIEQSIEGIDVSRTKGLSNGEAHLPSNTSPKAPFRHFQDLGKGKQGHLERPDQNPNFEWPSSSRWNTTQNVPAPRARTSQQTVSRIEQVKNRSTPDGHGEDHDDLYYASPKVTGGRRTSPRLLARENSPKEPERAPEPTVRQANVRTDPPNKLSRQLRNANGVVESHTEQTTDNIITSMENSTGDIRIQMNSKKSKAPIPAKSRNAAKESSKPTEKVKKRNGRAAATKEPPKDNLTSSPKLADSTIQTSENIKATTTELKSKNAPRNKKERAKPMPKRAAIKGPSEGSASYSRTAMKKKVEENGSAEEPVLHKPRGMSSEGNDDTIWDVGQAYSEEESQNLKQPRQPAKTKKKQDARAPKPGNNTTEAKLHSYKAKAIKPLAAKKKDSVAGIVKSKPPPPALSQPRPQRAAAIKANKKIQGLEESDEIVDDEEVIVIPTLTRSKEDIYSVTAKTPKDPQVRNSGGGRKCYGRKLPDPSFSITDLVPDSVSPDSLGKQKEGSVPSPKAHSSTEEVALVKHAPTEALQAVAGDTGVRQQKENPITVSETSLKVGHPGHSDNSNIPDSAPAGQIPRSGEAKVDLIPDSVPQVYEPIIEPELAPLKSTEESQVNGGFDNLSTTNSKPVKEHVQHAAVSVRNTYESHNVNTKPLRVERETNPPQVPKASISTKQRERRTSPRLAEAAKKLSVISQVPTTVKVRERRTSPRLAEAAKKNLVAPQAPTAPMTVEIRERRTSPRLAEAVKKNPVAPQAPTAPMTVKVRERKGSTPFAEDTKEVSPKRTSKRLDPFVARLNASIPKLKETNAMVKNSQVLGNVNGQSKRPESSRSTEVERPLCEPKESASDAPDTTSFEEAKQTEKAPRRSRSAMQVDGEVTSSPTPSVKAAGESAFSSGFRAKRNIEQMGDTSNKRVKIAPRAHDIKNTPPAFIGKKPLVIGFSSKGPKNQGTVSATKSMPVRNAETSAPDVAEMRKHELANDRIHHAEAGFASEEEACGSPPEDIEHRVKFGAVAEKNFSDLQRRDQVQGIQNVNAVVNGNAHMQRNGAEKRKLAPFLNEPAPWEHEQPPKRQKREDKTPPAAQNFCPKLLPDISSAFIHDRSQRLCSQNSRVNENGSPMPFFITRNEDTAAEEHESDEDDGKYALAEARLEEQYMLQDDDPISLGPFVPPPALVSTAPIARPKRKANQSLSNNSKQVPSSPHASSTFGAMPPHHLCHDGEMLNLETKERIVPTKPQDPFLGGTQNPQNSFMNALRRSTEYAAKQTVSKASNNQILADEVMPESKGTSEYLDRTLVEPTLRKKYKKVYVSANSASSQSGSSTQVSQPDESSQEESDAETEAKWRKGLEPHQDNMLESLLTISHRLIRHLVDKETALKDMVTDFGNHGNKLVESYEKALRDRIEKQRADDDQRYQNLINTIEKAQAGRSSTSQAIFRYSVQDQQAQWQMQQQALMRSMSAALEACAE